jgi:hypothetical protein
LNQQPKEKLMSTTNRTAEGTTVNEIEYVRLLDEAEEIGHDGLCDHPGCTQEARWLIAEPRTPELWPDTAQAALAFYCAAHVAGYPIADWAAVDHTAAHVAAHVAETGFSPGMNLWLAVQDNDLKPVALR